METINHGDNGGGVTRQMWDRMATDVDANFAEHTTDLAQKVIKTVKKTIGAVGVTGCDYNFATAADYAEQSIELEGIVPAKARILDVFTFTNTTFATATTLVADVGTTEGGAELIASATIKAANAFLQPAVGAAFTLTAITNAAKSVFVNATPDSGTTWAAITAGKMSVYVTYIDVTDL